MKKAYLTGLILIVWIRGPKFGTTSEDGKLPKVQKKKNIGLGIPNKKNQLKMGKEEYTRDNIVDSIIELLIKNPKLVHQNLHEGSHIDRDLKLDNAEIKKLVTDLEKKFQIRITSNVTVFAREVGQLAFYIENQLRGDQ